MERKAFVVITGPTAVGKSNIAIKLAQMIKGEIISADSMQVYKHMDIGTAKVNKEQQELIKHYLIDEVNPDEEFNVVKFKKLAEKYINTILSKGKVPIITGGTGLYINSLIKNIQFSKTVKDEEYRNKLIKLSKEKGNKYIHDLLKKVDPITAEKFHPNDLQRLIRALEVYKHTQKPISEHQRLSTQEPSPYKHAIIGLKMDRQVLYERINSRVENMIKEGLVEEVKKLIEMGYNKNMVSMQGLGYKETINYIEGKISLRQAIDLIKRDTRRYAKRQMTWFNKNKEIYWLDIRLEDKNKNETIKNSLKYIEEIGII